MIRRIAPNIKTIPKKCETGLLNIIMPIIRSIIPLIKKFQKSVFF